MQSRLGGGAVPVVAAILFLLVVLTLIDLHPIVSAATGVLAVIVARDILVVYAPAGERGHGAKRGETRH